MIRRRTGAKSRNISVNFTDVFNNIKKSMYSEAADTIAGGFEEMVIETPVETGYAASNWRVRFGNSSLPKTPPKDGGPYLSKSQVITSGIDVLKLVKKYGFQEDLYFSNVTPYIGYLENNHNPKQFWIRESIQKMSNKLSGMKKRGS